MKKRTTMVSNKNVAISAAGSVPLLHYWNGSVATPNKPVPWFLLGDSDKKIF